MKKNIDLVIDGIAPEKVMYDTDNHSLVVLYPAQGEFKRRDILASDNILLIFDEYANKEKELLHSLWSNIRVRNRTYNKNWTSKYFTYATDEQIAQLHKELKKEGKKWNEETLEIEDLDISDIVIDWISACEYLNKPMPKNYVYEPNSDFEKQINAQIELQLIREAWNKFDGFVVDWNDSSQGKHYPTIRENGKVTYLYASVNKSINESCYSFKTKERAIQFGSQFKDLLKEAMGL